jgi:hypothetical protein
MLLLHCTCAAIRDARLLCQLTNINTKIEAVLSLAVQVHSDFWLTLYDLNRAILSTHLHQNVLFMEGYIRRFLRGIHVFKLWGNV